MDVLVTGRRCTISDEFREKVTSRIASIERFRDRVIRVEVQVSANPHKKQPDQATRVEITLWSKGPVVRAEANADEKGVAFEHALDRLKGQLKRAADRRKTHRGLRTPQSGDALWVGVPEGTTQNEDQPTVRKIAGLEVTGDGPLVVREKVFDATPLSLAQALDEMELVGHDFFLYVDAETLAPSVVYRRKAYDYGVIHLRTDAGQDAAASR